MGEEDPPIAIPEWVVTFGDMMSLLLTFFIMLVSLSEIKQEETYQALVNSMQQEFGYSKATESLTPGDHIPRETSYNVLATEGRAKKKNTAKGGVPDKAPHGEEPMVRIIRPGQTTAVGSVVFFGVADDALDSEAKMVLTQTAEQLRGKPQKIEVRGHTSAEFAARTAGTDEAVMLGFRRASAVRRFLIDEAKIDANRFRMSSAGDAEPMQRSGGSSAMAKNSRVEVFLLDENVDDLSETAVDRPTNNASSSEVPAEKI
jgi:chemotaxis protein MotB